MIGVNGLGYAAPAWDRVNPNATDAAPSNARSVEPFKLWTLDELAALGPPTWRIERVLPDAALSVIFGVEQTYKSFIALDWALSIAAGVPWLDHDVTAGNVVYVAAEGGPGLDKRADAWRATHDGDPADRFRVIPHAVDLRSSDSIVRLRYALRDQLDAAPVQLVVDTWSRNMPGANENSAEDTSAAVGKLDDIRGEFGCGVLVVHHAGLETGRERGSTALAYAADCRWETDGKPRAPQVTLRNLKMKDWSSSPPLALRRHVVGEGEDASLIMLPAADPCYGHRQVVKALDGADAVTQNKLTSLIGGNATDARNDARAAVDCPRCPVASWPGQRRAVMYGRSDQVQVPL